MRIFFNWLKLAFPLFFALFVSCATIPTLDVTYKIMPKSNILEGNEVFFQFVDKRTDKEIIGKGARKLYENYSGNINFILSKEGSGEYLAGIYDIESLFRKAFAFSLENNGLKLLDKSSPDASELIIKLNKFILDLEGRQWIAAISYNAEFIKNAETVVRKFKGEGQKFRISGLNQSHMVVSEVFTDMINQLDIKSLFARGIQ